MRDAAQILGATIVLALAVKTLILDAVHVPSGSMENTLLVGDFVLVNKIVYGSRTPFFSLPGFGRPARGDVIVFYAPDRTPGELYVKRLAGLPGDTVMFRGGDLFVNGSEVAPPSAAKPSSAPAPDFGPVVVPRDRFFALGDNREGSLDSRSWGCVPFGSIVGRAMMVYWSVDAGRGIRWARPGTLVR